MSQQLLHDPRIIQLDRIKPVVASPEPSELVRLPLVRRAFIYQRLSTHEQRKKSLWSLEMQDALREQATADGYRDKQIIVERRDLGISGTKGREERPGLAALIHAIEADEVEAVYVVHISCISRDQTLIDGLEFGELCKQHRVLIVMPTMHLNLRDSLHLRLYRQEIERAADEIELLKLRLGGPKRHKALSGRALAARARHPLPRLPPEVPAGAVTRSSLRRNAHPLRGPGSYLISPSLIPSVVTNPVYLGWWVVEGGSSAPTITPRSSRRKPFSWRSRCWRSMAGGMAPWGGAQCRAPAAERPPLVCPV